MAALNFSRILLKLTSKGSILRDTLHSQDGLNLVDIRFCPIQCTLNMQSISLDYLQKLVTEGTFMPSTVDGTLEFSGMTAILLIFQADDQHEQVTDVYIGLVVRHIESHLYGPEKIFDTRNNPARTCLCRCMCHATLQYMNDDPHYCRAYGGSHPILPRGAQYKEQLFPEILKPQNHWALLIDPITQEPFLMKLVGHFRSMDPIFKGCYGGSFLYSDVDLG